MSLRSGPPGHLDHPDRSAPSEPSEPSAPSEQATDPALRFYDRCATFYDGDYDAADYDHDLEFYLGHARASGGPVLELGCGTGRVLLHLARHGIEMVGMDLSPRMLERLRAKLETEPREVARRVSVVEGDLCQRQLGRLFPLVTAPFRVVQHLVEPGAPELFLANAARHLEPGGELVFDVFHPDDAALAGGSELTVDIERLDLETGDEVRRVSRAVHHPERRIMEVEFEWLVGAPGQRPRTADSTHTRVRWFTPEELERLLEAAGFELLEMARDFSGGALHPEDGEDDSEDLVVRARRRR